MNGRRNVGGTKMALALWCATVFGCAQPSPAVVASPVINPLPLQERVTRCDEAELRDISVEGASSEVVHFAETYEDEFREGPSFAHACAGQSETLCEAAARERAHAEHPNSLDVRVNITGDAIGIEAELLVDGQSVTFHTADNEAVAARLLQLQDAGHEVSLRSTRVEYAADSRVAQVNIASAPTVVHQPIAELRVTPNEDASIRDVLMSIVRTLEDSTAFTVLLVEPREDYIRVRVRCESEL